MAIRNIAAVVVPPAMFAVYAAWARLDPIGFRSIALKETGVVELGTALLFAVAALFAARVATNVAPFLYRSFFASFALLCLFVALEEVSWGQHIFKWDTPDLFTRYNSQNETNLHNFYSNKPTRRLRNVGQVTAVVLFVVLPMLLVFRESISRTLSRSKRIAEYFRAFTAGAYQPGHWSFYVLPRLELSVLILVTLTTNLLRSLQLLHSLELLELREFYMSCTAAAYAVLLDHRIRHAQPSREMQRLAS